MDFLSSMKTAAEAATSIATNMATTMATPSPRSGEGASLASAPSATSSAASDGSSALASVASRRGGEPCELRMVNIELMTPRSPGRFGAAARDSGDATRSLVQARREALGDRWLVGLGGALQRSGGESETVPPPPLQPPEPEPEPEPQGARQGTSIGWLLEELVPEWSKLTALRGATRSSRITIDDEGEDDEDEDDDQHQDDGQPEEGDEEVEDEESAAAALAQEAAAKAQQAMAEALAASAEAAREASQAIEVGEEAVAVSLNFGALQEGVGTIPHAQSTLSREEKWRVERILAGEEADDAEEAQDEGADLVDLEEEDEEEPEDEVASDDEAEWMAEAGMSGNYIAVVRNPPPIQALRSFLVSCSPALTNNAGAFCR